MMGAKNVLLHGAAATLVASLGWRVYTVPLKARAAAPVYTVVRTETAFDKAGNGLYTTEYLDAVGTDGSRVSRIWSPVGRQRHITFANGEGVAINELIGKKSTYPKKFPFLQVKRDPDRSCSSDVDAKVGAAIEGTDYIGGHRAVRFGHVNAEGDWKAWYAPDAGCALIQQRFEYDGGVTVQQLVSLGFGEPDPALFQVPASIQETPPSGLYVPQCLNGKCDKPLPDSVKTMLDKKYYEVRTQAP